jgi:glycosyltransferase involved in cell wall biosynthesis
MKARASCGRLMDDPSPTTPFVSVVVCVHNEERWLESCIDSLLSQNYPDERYEIILIDDGSSDSSHAIAQRAIESRSGGAPRIRMGTQRHSGLSAARNAGAFLASGEIVAYIDGDALADESWLKEQVRPFIRNERVAVVGGRIEILNPGAFAPEYLDIARHLQIFGPTVYRNPIIGCNFAVRRSAFDAVGGFYEEFRQRGDESVFLEKLRGVYEWDVAPGAIVRHERPASFRSWLATEALEGMFGMLVFRHPGRSVVDTLRRWLPLGLRFSVVALPFVGIAALVSPSAYSVGAAGVLLAIYLRETLVKPQARAVVAELRRKYGVWIMPFHLLMDWARQVMYAKGVIRGLWRYRNTELEARSINGANITDLLDSQNGPTR